MTPGPAARARRASAAPLLIIHVRPVSLQPSCPHLLTKVPRPAVVCLTADDIPQLVSFDEFAHLTDIDR